MMMTHEQNLKAKIGDRLHNGAILIAKSEYNIVLAVNPDSPHPYVTWVMNPYDGSTHSGDYFRDISDAVRSFKSRI